MKAKKTSVFPSIRTVAGIPDQEIEDSIYRLHETQLQLRRLANTYYGDTTSFLPYMYRIEHGQAGRHEPARDQQYYIFDPDACDTFIREMTYYYDLAFWRSYQIDPSDTLIDFIQSFLYLAIRIACPDERLFPYFDYGSYGDEIYGLLNNGTFLDIINLSRLSNIHRTEEAFHRRYEIGIKDNIMPGLFHPIDIICDLLGRSGCYLHPAASKKEDNEAYEADLRLRRTEYQEMAEESGMSLEEFEQMVKENEEAAIEEWENREEETIDPYEAALQGYAEGFPDTEHFIQAARYYRDHLFEHSNQDITDDLTNAIHLFLAHNGHSVLGNADAYLQAHAEVTLSISELEKMNTKKIE